MCITRISISLYLRHYRPGAALYLSLIYVEYIVNQQPRRGRWIESTEPRIILFLSALQKIHLIESKLSPVFCVYMYACSELIGPPIRKILPRQICYLANFIIINSPRNSQVKKTVIKNTELTIPRWIVFDCVLFSMWTFRGKNYSEQHPSTNSRLILATLLRNWWISIKCWKFPMFIPSLATLSKKKLLPDSNDDKLLLVEMSVVWAHLQAA